MTTSFFNPINICQLLLAVLLIKFSASTLPAAEIHHQASGGNLLIPQFDPQLGSLTGISWEYLDVVSVSYEGRNESTLYLGFTASVTVAFYLGLSERPSSAQLQRVPLVSDFVTVNPGQIVNFPIGSTTFHSGSIGFSNPQSFPQFIGSGSVRFHRFVDVTQPVFSQPSAKDAMNHNINIRDNPILTVTYSYLPVPEPSVWSVAGLICVALISVRLYIGRT